MSSEIELSWSNSLHGLASTKYFSLNSCSRNTNLETLYDFISIIGMVH